MILSIKKDSSVSFEYITVSFVLIWHSFIHIVP